MSSISSTSTSAIQTTQRPAHAHKNRVADEISSGASAGTISKTDATALTSALDSIDASLKSGDASKAGSAGNATTARLDPSQTKSRIDGLIADQVSSGALTSDQATALKSLFAKGEKGDGGTVGSRPPGPPPGSDAKDAPSQTSDAASADGTSLALTSDLLASFIKQLQTTQSSNTGYASRGSAGSSSTSSALVFDFRS